MQVEAVHHGAFKSAKGEKLADLKVSVGDMVVGGKYYFPHEISYDKEKAEWLYFMECVYVKGHVRRAHYADGHEYTNSPQDKVPWEDLDALKDSSKTAYKIWEPELKRAEMKGDVEQFVASHATIKRQSESKPKRVELLIKTIHALITANSVLRKEDTEDAVAKAMEEIGSGGVSVFGSRPKNVEIVLDYFNGPGEVEVDEEANDEEEVTLKGLMRLMKEMNTEIKGVGKEVDGLKTKMAIKKVQEASSWAHEEGEAEEEIVKKKVGAIIDTKGDGDCEFHLAAGVKALQAGVEVGKIVYTTEKVDEMKSEILNVAVGFVESEIEKHLGSSEEKVKHANDRFQELTSKLPDEFLAKLTAQGGKPGEARVRGGHVEMCMATRDSEVRVVMIEGDAIYRGIDRNVALAQSVRRTTWPGEQAKKKVCYAVRIKGHFWWGVVEENDKQRAIFSTAEGHEACGLIVDYLLSRDPPKGPISMTSLLAMSKARRGAAIAEELSQPPAKKKSIKRKKKGGAWSDVGGREEDGAGWMVVERRKKAAEGRKVQMRVSVHRAPPVSTLVVWTVEPEKLQEEMKRSCPAAAKLVAGVRIKKDHTIIMADPSEVELLQSMEKGLQSAGIDARVYRTRPSRLAHAAQRGMDQQVRGVGVCNHFLQRRACTYGRHCKFRCYKDEHGKGWGI